MKILQKQVCNQQSPCFASTNLGIKKKYNKWRYGSTLKRLVLEEKIWRSLVQCHSARSSLQPTMTTGTRQSADSRARTTSLPGKFHNRNSINKDWIRDIQDSWLTDGFLARTFWLTTISCLWKPWEAKNACKKNDRPNTVGEAKWREIFYNCNADCNISLYL